jgi:hypothetical protein
MFQRHLIKHSHKQHANPWRRLDEVLEVLQDGSKFFGVVFYVSEFVA